MDCKRRRTEMDSNESVTGVPSSSSLLSSFSSSSMQHVHDFIGGIVDDDTPYPWLPEPPLNPKLMTDDGTAHWSQQYSASQPYKHMHITDLIPYARMKKVQNEITKHLSTTYRETDLFKIHQTIDLNNIPLSAQEAQDLPELMAMRKHIYSKTFRAFLEKVSNCGPLTNRVDCSANLYKNGCHLLCHDDVISTRRLSYIIYLSHDNKDKASSADGTDEQKVTVDRKTERDDVKEVDAAAQGWASKDGGALELYPVEKGTVLPHAVPCNLLLPYFNSMVVFQVVPGVSYHSVQEVFSKDKTRLSIQGWFHASERPEGWDKVASLRQLQTKNSGSSSSHDSTTVGIDLEDYDDQITAKEDLVFLRQYINPIYTSFSTIGTIRQKFQEEQGSVQLADFLHPDLADQILALMKRCDTADQLGMNGMTPPDYRAGVCSKLDEQKKDSGSGGSGAGGDNDGKDEEWSAGMKWEWALVGPPIKQRFLHFMRTGADSTYVAAAVAATTIYSDDNYDDAKVEDNANIKLGQLLFAVQTELLQSRAFARLVEWFTGLLPYTCHGTIRRFRPGLDYTVGNYAHLLKEEEAKMDVTLCFVDASDDTDKEEEKEQGKMKGRKPGGIGQKKKKEAAEKEKKVGAAAVAAAAAVCVGPPKASRREMWESDEFGGFEAHVSVDKTTEGDDAEAYVEKKKGTNKKEGRLNSRENEEEENEGKGASEEAEGGDGDKEEDETTLLSVSAAWNTLNIVLRRPQTMRFVRYVSAGAPGSRWDVSNEYDVTSRSAEEEDGEEEEAEDEHGGETPTNK